MTFKKQPVEFDDGWSRCPHGLYRLRNLTALDKVVLLYLWSQTDAYLAKLTVNIIRNECGSSSVNTSLTRIVDAGFAVRHEGGFRGAHSFELLAAPWMELFGPHPKRPVRNRIGDQSEIGSVTSPKSDRLEEQVEDHLEEPGVSDETRGPVDQILPGIATPAAKARPRRNSVTTITHEPAGRIAKLALDLWVAEYGKTHVQKIDGQLAPRRPWALRDDTPESTATRWKIAMRNVKTVTERAITDALVENPVDHPFGEDASVRRAAEVVAAALGKADTVASGPLWASLLRVTAARSQPVTVDDRGFGVSPAEQQHRERTAAARAVGRPVVTGV